MMATATQAAKVSTRSVEESHGHSLAILMALFFAWGLLTCFNEILVAHLKLVYDLTQWQLTFVQVAVFASYFLFSMPVARLIDWIGYQRTMVLGLLSMGAGAFIFVPAAITCSPWLFLIALVMMVSGITALQVSANPYVTVLGTSNRASSRLSLARGFNSLGAAIAPFVGGMMVLSAAPVTLVELHAMSPEALHYYRVAQAASVRIPYLLLGLMSVVVAAVIGSSRLPDVVYAKHRSESPVADTLWNRPNLIFACIGIFLCVGAELSIGSMLGEYLSQPRIGHMSVASATRTVSLYWMGIMAGQFMGAGLLLKIRTAGLLSVSAFGATALVTVSMLSTGHIAMWSILAVGLLTSVMFPIMFSLGIAALGPLTSRGSGVLIMSMVGGAVIPLAQNILAGHVGLQHALVLPVVCYAYILCFAVRASSSRGERFGN